MLRFSLWHTFPAITVFGCGLAVARGPNGDWVDVPFSVLTFYLAFSLLRQSRTLRGAVATTSSGIADTDRGCRVWAAGLMALAIMLVAAWSLRFLAATDPEFPTSHNLLNFEFELPVLPRALGLLTMLAAITVNAWRDKIERPSTWIRRCTFGLGLFAAVLLIVTLQANQMLIPVLVHIAICGIESAEPLQLATEGLELNSVTRTMRFAIAGFAGCAVLLLNLIIVELLARGQQIESGLQNVGCA